MINQIEEEKKEFNWILKGTDNYKVELIFNESEMKIIRDSRGSFGSVIISILFLVASTSMFIFSIRNLKEMVFIVSTLLMLLSLFFIVYALYDYLKVLKINRRTFKLSEIKFVTAKIKKKMVHLSFQFNDNSRNKISIEKSELFDRFTDLLKKNYIVMNEIN